jgi:hypothetical protein
MHGKRGNLRNRWTDKTASNHPGNLEANSNNCRFSILIQMRPGKDGLIIFRMISPPLQGLCSKDGLADNLADIHAAVASIPLETGFCPERWRHAVDIMLEKVPGISRSKKLRIIQLLEADLNQVLRAAFVRNVTKLAQHHKGFINNHQYGRSHRTCISYSTNFSQCKSFSKSELMELFLTMTLKSVTTGY